MGHLTPTTEVVAVRLDSVEVDSGDQDGKVTKIEENGEVYTSQVSNNYDALATAGTVPEASIGQFLARPVLVGRYTWNIGEYPPQTLNPLALFLADPYVKDKIQNYSFIRGKLHMKFTITGSSFHYGKLIAAVEHWPSGEGLWLNQLTQLPYVVLDPNTATGGTLEIPFLFPFNAYPLTVQDRTGMDYAKVHLRTVNNLTVMGDTTLPVYIQAYVWMTEVSLYMPTAARLDSELAKSAVELGNTLTAAATTAPVIGKYARATMIAAQAAKDIGAELGFSRPNKPIVETKVLTQQVSNLSNFNTFDTSAKLALDAQQETYVDGLSVGMGSSDDMSFSNIVALIR